MVPTNTFKPLVTWIPSSRNIYDLALDIGYNQAPNHCPHVDGWWLVLEEVVGSDRQTLFQRWTMRFGWLLTETFLTTDVISPNLRSDLYLHLVWLSFKGIVRQERNSKLIAVLDTRKGILSGAYYGLRVCVRCQDGECVWKSWIKRYLRTLKNHARTSFTWE